jgi:hypothetical protein
MTDTSTTYRDALNGLVPYADIALPSGSVLPKSAPSDPAGAPVYNAGDKAATAAGQGAGNSSLAAILSALQAVLSVQGTVTANVGTTNGLGLDASLQAILAKDEAIRALLAGTLKTREQPGVTPVQTYVAVSAFASGNTAGAGSTNATVALAVTTTSSSAFLSIDNTGSADAEVWFGAIPADANVGQSPKRGKLLPAGAGLFFDVRIPVGPIYVTAPAATGLSVVTG